MIDKARRNQDEEAEAMISLLTPVLKGFLTDQGFEMTIQAQQVFVQNGVKNPNEALSGSYDFMHLFGHVGLGYMWARMAVVATKALADGTGDPAFYEAKLATARFYMARRLPAVSMHKARILSGATPVMALDADHF